MTRTKTKPAPAPAITVSAIPKQNVPARLAALSSLPIGELKAEWRRLFTIEPPPYSRSFLERRLAYQIQELAYGGLKRETLERLEALGEKIDGKKGTLRRAPREQRPVAGTRLIREYQGVPHTVTVTRDGYEFEGRPYQSLSAIARAITGTRWNGWAFFGLRKPGA